jgi:hypothetical protein
MALIVEDGTGKVDAESYESVANYTTYCAARGLDLGAATDADKEADLRKGTAFLDGYFRLRGIRGSATQALEFPRAAGTLDRDGYEITGVPLAIKHAACEMGFAARSAPDNDVLPNTTVGIKSETVGPISTTYMDGMAATPSYPKVVGMLRRYTRLDEPVPVPLSMAPTSEPFFGVDLHESVGGPIPGADEQTDDLTLEDNA